MADEVEHRVELLHVLEGMLDEAHEVVLHPALLLGIIHELFIGQRLIVLEVLAKLMHECVTQVNVLFIVVQKLEESK